ncbi:MAG: Uma2 family endonuclease [Chloroflexi bacterium]|nr:Uma2 family endonuclease [Chloroflexota bacterium]
MAIDYPQQQPPEEGGPMSVEEYLQLEKSTYDDRYEYVDGVAYLVPAYSVAHDDIAFNVRTALKEHFQSGPCSVLGPGMQILLGSKSNGKKHYVYPDVTISCDVADRRRGNTLIRSPRIVVEVLSPSTEKLDRGKKLEAYKTYPTIQEIVLIDQFVQVVEVYRRNEEDGTTWSHAFYGPGSTVELPSIDVYITMDEIYKGIDFDEPLVEE